MSEIIALQGRNVKSEDIRFIRQLIKENPSWHRTRLSKELCDIWNWRNCQGSLKDMACRTLLLKLERRGLLELPPQVKPIHNHLRNKLRQPSLHSLSAIECSLKALTPLEIIIVRAGKDKELFNTFIHLYHYLEYSGPQGENMMYLVFDKERHPLACVLFGAAAWKAAPRDLFIGWDIDVRKRNLQLIANNSRFLILPWVRVPHLASHILGRIARRISDDWMHKYGHPLHLLETFVERERFRGVCYRAANWRHVGQTKGRSRNDRNNDICVPIKDIYLYPLSANYSRELCRGE